jgi:hypothetical protein
MFLLAIVRLVLGVLSRAPGVSRSMDVLRTAASSRRGASVSTRKARFPHEWMYLDYDLTNVPGSRCSRPEAFAKDAHPLRSMFRLLRHLAGLPEPSLVRVATVSRDPRPPAR